MEVSNVSLSRNSFLLFAGALDEENERLMYDIVREMKATVVSVGNRSSLPEFHDTCLTLKTGGAWNVAAL